MPEAQKTKKAEPEPAEAKTEEAKKPELKAYLAILVPTRSPFIGAALTAGPATIDVALNIKRPKYSAARVEVDIGKFTLEGTYNPKLFNTDNPFLGVFYNKELGSGFTLSPGAETDLFLGRKGSFVALYPVYMSYELEGKKVGLAVDAGMPLVIDLAGGAKTVGLYTKIEVSLPKGPFIAAELSTDQVEKATPNVMVRAGTGF